MSLHAPFLRACFCKRCVNADAANKYDNVARDVVHVHVHQPPPPPFPTDEAPPFIDRSCAERSFVERAGFAERQPFDEPQRELLPLEEERPQPEVAGRGGSSLYDRETWQAQPSELVAPPSRPSTILIESIAETPPASLDRTNSMIVHVGAQTPTSRGTTSRLSACLSSRKSIFNRQATANLEGGVRPYEPAAASPKRRASIRPQLLVTDGKENHVEAEPLMSDRDDEVIDAMAEEAAAASPPPATAAHWDRLSSASHAQLETSLSRSSLMRRFEALANSASKKAPPPSGLSGPSPNTNRLRGVAMRKRANTDHTPGRTEHWDVPPVSQRAKSNAHELGVAAAMRYSPNDSAHDNVAAHALTRRSSCLTTTEEPEGVAEGVAEGGLSTEGGPPESLGEDSFGLPIGSRPSSPPPEPPPEPPIQPPTQPPMEPSTELPMESVAESPSERASPEVAQTLVE